MNVCSECDKPVKGHGYCSTHYARWRKHGNPSIVLPPHHKAHGVRKYTLNEEYFDHIETPERAYWLGFITADGSVGTNQTGRNGWQLRIMLKNSDIDHLRKFSCAIESDYPIRESFRPKSPEANISISSRHMVESLGKLGVVPRKSLIAEPPEEVTTSEYAASYWRGLFDGDGCIHKRSDKKNSWSIIMCGSYGCVNGFAEWGRKITGSKARVSNRAYREDVDFWRWHIEGSKGVQPLAKELLLAGVGFGLDRKQVQLEELCEFNFAEHKTCLDKGRAVQMRDAWATGRHPRSKRG